MPRQQLEQLQAELLQAMACTQSLEAQVQQLKQQAAAASEQHKAAVQQQAQQGGVEAAGKVAAALEAASLRHWQQMQALQERLLEAHQQLQAARSELSAVEQEQQLRQQRTVEQEAQTGSPAAAVPAASQTGAGVSQAEAALLPAQVHWQPPPSSVDMHQSPSRSSSSMASSSTFPSVDWVVYGRKVGRLYRIILHIRNITEIDHWLATEGGYQGRIHMLPPTLLFKKITLQT